MLFFKLKIMAIHEAKYALVGWAKYIDEGLAMAVKAGMKSEIQRFEVLQAKLKNL